MNSTDSEKPFIAIACGGTGGHLFPGLAVAEQLKQRGCRVGLLISPKDVDQQAVKNISGLEIFTLPAVGLQNRNYFSFLVSFIKSLAAARKIFRQDPPAAVLAMGGFTSAPPIIAGQLFRAKTYLHESNTIPGRANRFLARLVDMAFIGFPETAARLKARKTEVTGTPVRPQFQVRDAAECRAAFGLLPDRPTILVVGGSQGASGLNEMILGALPLLAARNWQWLHLTGMNDFEKVRAGYAAHKIHAVVKPFLAEMDLALGAATAAVSRAGASSQAELAALRLPSLLVPFPAAADNHQFFNARIFALSGAAQMLEQRDSSPEKTAAYLTSLVEDETLRAKMATALAQWHAPNSAAQIAENILHAVLKKTGTPTSEEDTTLLTRGQPRPTSGEANRNLSAA
jgi:UDP-N-acetylglucosamine--N-acetylmuramyl-(pentapeptide) pyrophosphoryl-undecaprenol N-acetylglucosamine transferase